MADDTLKFDGLYMPRKSFDIFEDSNNFQLAIGSFSKMILDTANKKYSDGERWSEMDEFWTREHAAYLVSMMKNKGYSEHLPGRYYTYSNLADIIVNSLENPQEAVTAEIGSGSGICLVLQAQRGIKRVYGFDKSYGALGFFEDLAQHNKIEDKIETKQGDFYSTGYSNGQFDATFNMDVFEHLDRFDQRRLIDEMARITKPGGIILVGIPNPSSPLHKFSREKEKKFFNNIIEYIFPQAKYSYSVDLGNMMDESGLKIEKEGAVSIAPPSPIPLVYLDEEAQAMYAKIPRLGKPEQSSELLKFWKIMEEKVITPEELMKFGWYRYIVGRKPSK